MLQYYVFLHDCVSYLCSDCLANIKTSSVFIHRGAEGWGGVLTCEHEKCIGCCIITVLNIIIPTVQQFTNFTYTFAGTLSAS